MNRIDINHVSKYFKVKQINGKNFLDRVTTTLKALDDISFSVGSGEMVGIIGVNGSGKTTLLRTIAGIYHPTKGTINVKGKIAPLLQIGTGFHEELNAKDNIILYGMYLGISKKEIMEKIKDIIEFAELEEFTGMKLKYFSTGMRARLAFSTALQINPDILLVDEILAVGDAAFRKKSFESFLMFKKQNKTILYTSHNLEKMRELCDKIVLLNKGKMEMFGDPEEVLDMYKQIISQKSEEISKK